MTTKFEGTCCGCGKLLPQGSNACEDCERDFVRDTNKRPNKIEFIVLAQQADKPTAYMNADATVIYDNDGGLPIGDVTLTKGRIYLSAPGGSHVVDAVELWKSYFSALLKAQPISPMLRHPSELDTP